MGNEQVVNWQKIENHAQIPQFSFTAREEAVIYEAADLRRFPVTFPANRSEPYHGVS